MGQTTPNIGIYIPDAGETNYDASYQAGMNNIDAHDHSGGPNKGLPLSSSGISDGSVTKEKLATDVVTAGEGLAVDGSNPNALVADGILNSLYKVASNGVLCRTAANTATPRTITGTSNQVSVTNGDGVSGNPTIALPSTIYTNISFDSGTTTLNNYSKDTFTPALSFGGASVGLTYTTQVGKYWRIGDIIYWSFFIKVNAVGSSTGDAAVTLTGLPDAENSTVEWAASAEVFINTYPSGTTYAVGEILGNTNVVNVVACGAGNQTKFTHTNFTTGDEITMSGFYWVT